ncbi:MAG: 16S rRNA (cytidine(1402)-2'-O)-methyltransferase [Clostridium sp.]|nr:16S rRNA (cytidine(1402)-2'-O)-methyltransferase [Clostridium sp.]MCM1398649.1 16S rRNA (cytidine(1402)-2'-O)-methyltransferase [Clostridium sp.]MCM1459935.1 16S rRNA (cytidine(1402)-2'-O)-methyltransferase [Bacteroides sp.]
MGILYLVATPIGNLEDMTYRAVRVLKEVTLIAAEDTRNSRKLLNHFEIKTPMTSYHEHNKYEKADGLVKRLLAGDDIAVITDAGTPGISDPGEELVKKCYEAGIPVVPVPGACAAVNGLVASGQPARRFAFEAFLPMDKKERRTILTELTNETRTIVIYEAPHRLVKTLAELNGYLGDRELTVCKELTKKHETFLKTTIVAAQAFFAENEPKGEYLLVIKGKPHEEIAMEAVKKWENIDVCEHIKLYINQGMDKKEATRQVAQDRGVSKRDIYEYSKLI